MSGSVTEHALIGVLLGKAMPCPFNHGRAPHKPLRIMSAGRLYYVECSRCLATGPAVYDANEAVELWNDR